MKGIKVSIVLLLCFLIISIYAKKINKSHSKNIKLKVDGINNEWTARKLIASINMVPKNAKKDYTNAYTVALYADNNSLDMYFAVRYLNDFDFLFTKNKSTGTAGELYIKKTRGKISFQDYDYVAHLPYGFSTNFKKSSFELGLFLFHKGKEDYLLDKTIHQSNKFIMYHKNFIEFRIPLKKIKAKKGDIIYFFFRDHKENFKKKFIYKVK